MTETLTPQEIKRAQAPHNLLISSILLFDIMLAPAAIALDIGFYGLLLPLLLSCAVIAYVYRRSRRAGEGLVAAHWRWAWRNARWLLLGYAVSGLMLLAALLLSLAAHDANMKQIILTALTRIALMPTLIAVMVTLVMSASAYAQAGRGRVNENKPLTAE